MFEQDRRNVNTESDSEVLLNVFAHELDLQRVLTPEAVFRALEGVNRRAKGGYAVVCAVLGLGLLAFRDPHGIRPLVLGKRMHAEGIEYAVASESVALDVLGFERMRDTVSRSTRLQRIGGKPRSINAMSSSTMSPIFLKALSSAPARCAERTKPGSERTGWSSGSGSCG